MYTYKLKIVISKEMCEENGYNYDEVIFAVKDLCSQAKLTELENDEYGTNSFEDGMALNLALGHRKWFLLTAECFLWQNGEQFDITGEYDVEDALNFYLNEYKAGNLIFVGT